MKIISVVGARPQFIKLAPLSKKIRSVHQEILVHTGQHYDNDMSEIFFRELDLPRPDINLGIGSGNHGEQTGKMMIGLEEIFIAEKPDVIIVFGDTNSTLAASIVSSKLCIPLGHVEAGLRSYNKKMPEEINRVITDHLSHWLFVPSVNAMSNLKKEGLTEGVYVVGDIMYEAILSIKDRINDRKERLCRYSVEPEMYYLATIHRAENTDDIVRLRKIFQLLGEMEDTVLFPIHPRTNKKILEYGIELKPNIKLVPPTGYLDMITLITNSRCVITDSGGIQKEAYYLERKCITLRDETEWVETVSGQWNYLVGISREKFHSAVNEIKKGDRPEYQNLYGDGTTSSQILQRLTV